MKVKILIFFFIMLFQIKAITPSPYISKVYEYSPAPGQFVNELPKYQAGDTKNDMRLKAEECIADDQRVLVSLGGYGGYIVFGFDHMVENKPGKYDFKILANAFYAAANPNGGASKEGGSCEPGIVMVSYDANGNGKPDDEWYELAGSEYSKVQTIKNYRLTYYKPNENKVSTPNNSYPYLNDTTYIRWKSNQGTQGYVYRNTFHNQSYYPLWLNSDSLVFEGTKLANNYVDESGTGTYYVQYAFHWGYVDNQPNEDDRSNFNIEWAVDKNGNSVKLPGIHFIKVFTGVNQYCGWLGETSTEIMGAIDLHTQGVEIDVPVFTQNISVDKIKIEIKQGETILIVASIIPNNATNKQITWKSKNQEIASVSDGSVLGVSEGQTTISAITNDGYLIASTEVIVNGSTGINSSSEQKQFVSYSSGTLFLTGFENSNCTLFSMNGTDVLHFYCNDTKYQINKNLINGVYVLKCQNDKGVKVFKIIVL